MFSPEWLSLREPADAAARSAAVTGAVTDALRSVETLRVLDLAAGTGANVRYLLNRLPQVQDWLLADIDASLLALAPQRMVSWAETYGLVVSADAQGLRLSDSGRRSCRVTTRRVDLSSLADPDIFAGRRLVTASALLDLVSEPWLRRLVDRCSHAGASALFALSYDGRIRCEPDDPDDEMVRELVNRHQRTNKGFGPALGPDATDVAERCLTDAGYRVHRARSDWVLSLEAQELQRQLLEGWACAAIEIEPGRGRTIRNWHARRLALVDLGLSQIAVGHEDLSATIATG